MVDAAHRIEELETVQRLDPYKQWLDNEGIPVVHGVYCPDVGAVELEPWPRKGCTGAVVNLDGLRANPNGNDIHIVELAPGTASEPERHLYEEIVYVHSGRGATSVSMDEKGEQTFEWHAGSLFAIPLNADFQHFNGSGEEPARLVSVTTAPAVLRMFHFNEEFIYRCPVEFTERWGSESYFSAEGVMWRSRNTHVWESNFVPDARSAKLFSWKERGGGGRNLMLQMGEGNLVAHISSFQTGTYKKGHRHTANAHLYILDGTGYSLVWREGEERIKCDWQAGSLFMAGAGGGAWFHQHFNSGPQPARYLALRGGHYGSYKFGSNERYVGNQGTETPTLTSTSGSDKTDHGSDVSIQKGGIQCEYEDEDPEIHRIFEEELAKHGALCQMKNLSPYCTGELGPTSEGEWGDD